MADKYISNNTNSSNYNNNSNNSNTVARSVMPVIIIMFSIVLFFFTLGIGSIVFLKFSLSTIRDIWGREQVVYEIDSDKETVKKKTVSVEYIESMLSKQNQLITARDDFSGTLTIEEGRIPFITKKGFSMSYNGYVKAGIDLADREIVVSDDTIIIYLCEPVITDCCVDAESIVFYDKKRAIFNWTQNSDITEAIALAEDDIYMQAKEDGIILKAKEEAEALVNSLMEELADDYEIKIKWVREQLD